MTNFKILTNSAFVPKKLFENLSLLGVIGRFENHKPKNKIAILKLITRTSANYDFFFRKMGVSPCQSNSIHHSKYCWIEEIQNWKYNKNNDWKKKWKSWKISRIVMILIGWSLKIFQIIYLRVAKTKVQLMSKNLDHLSWDKRYARSGTALTVIFG